MSKRNQRDAKVRRRTEREASADVNPPFNHAPGCAFDGVSMDQCKIPGCKRRWTMDVEWADGWCVFLCAEHFDGFLMSPDPVHGRIVSVWQ